MKTRARDKGLAVAGRATGRLWVPADELDRVVMTGVDRGPVHVGSEGDAYIHFSRSNAFVNAGLSALLTSGFSGLSADRISHIGVSDASATAIAAATTTLPGTTEIKTLGSQAESAQTASGSATFTGTTVSDIYIIGLLRGATASTLSSAIGGTGTSPYNETFSLLLSAVTSFSLDLSYEVTAAAV